MLLSELEIHSLHFVVPKHKRDQFPLLRVICVEELSHRARWDGLEVSAQKNSLFFSGTMCGFAPSVSQSTQKEGKDFYWLLCSLYQTLCPVLLSFTGHGNPDLQLQVVNCLGLVKVFKYCLFVQSLTWWGPSFVWGFLRSNGIQMMSRSSDLLFSNNTCEIAGPNWELWHSCPKLW